jgi:hypothetical protein
MKEIQLTEEFGKSELLISSEPNWGLFEKVAETLESELGGSWVEKTDGIDQRYWDLQIEGELLTLHLEHYLGILAFSESKNLLLRAKLVIERKF